VPSITCEECGFDFAEDQKALIARCERFPASLRELLTSTGGDVLRRRRAPDVWSPLEYGAHVGEAEGSDGSPRSVETLLARAGHELAHHELDLRRGAGLVQL